MLSSRLYGATGDSRRGTSAGRERKTDSPVSG